MVANSDNCVNFPDAERYLRHGFSFFPLRKRSKKPLKPWEIFQERQPTPAEVQAWQDKGQLAQIAVVCGAVSGLLVLDVDDPETFDHWAQERSLHLPQTPCVFTSENGAGQRRHYYYRHPGGKIKNSTKQIPGADVKADGGYVVGPPSIHPSGNAYTWAPGLSLEDASLAEAPAWLLEYLDIEADTRVEVSASDLLPPDPGGGDPLAALLAGVAKGERNNAAAKIAGGYIARGDPQDRVLAMLRGWNTFNRPPLPDGELQKVVASISKREARKKLKDGVAQGDEPSPVTAPLTEEAREAALAGLGEMLGLPLVDVEGIKSDRSIWKLTLENSQAIILTSPQLVSQRRFQNRLVEAAHILPKSVGKKPGWDHVVNVFLAVSRIIEAGAEGSCQGMLQEMLINYIEQYRGIEYYPDDKKIPLELPFFIIRRNGSAELYARLDPLVLQAKHLGYPELKRTPMVALLTSLGHRTDHFNWAGITTRAWRLDKATFPDDIRFLIERRAIEGEEKARK